MWLIGCRKPRLGLSEALVWTGTLGQKQLSRNLTPQSSELHGAIHIAQSSVSEAGELKSAQIEALFIRDSVTRGALKQT